MARPGLSERKRAEGVLEAREEGEDPGEVEPDLVGEKRALKAVDRVSEASSLMLELLSSLFFNNTSHTWRNGSGQFYQYRTG
ncbi:hypothetical protein QJS04_geneDACA004114 [Acorus gramineus]|uniref:Uncharacterized protein n=1 Tax=Acorus gramineus TaxID=55184 RepID=A0AAV9BGV0_ACOGR|nr:hypothetical protein QJS04_geneDACA004114 [Acorus gramineus]